MEGSSKKEISFSLYIPVWLKHNKDSITQWKFCRLAGRSIEGTDLQVLEASQGGINPAAGARC